MEHPVAIEIHHVQRTLTAVAAFDRIAQQKLAAVGHGYLGDAGFPEVFRQRLPGVVQIDQIIDVVVGVDIAAADRQAADFLSLPPAPGAGPENQRRPVPPAHKPRQFPA